MLMRSKGGYYTTLQMIYPKLENTIKIDKQMDMYKRALGILGLDIAIATKDMKQLGKH